MIALRLSLWLALALGLSSAAHAQGTQCQTDPVGSRSSKCASEQFVTDSIAAAPQGTVKEVDTAGLANGGPITSIGTVTVTAAAKSDQQAASSAVLAVTPSQQQSHPSAAKAWLHYQGTGTPAILASYNVATVVRNAAGLYTITWTTPFTSANYAVLCTSNDNGSGSGMLCALETISAGTAQIVITTPSTLGAVDASHISVTAFGAQ